MPGRNLGHAVIGQVPVGAGRRALRDRWTRSRDRLERADRRRDGAAAGPGLHDTLITEMIAACHAALRVTRSRRAPQLWRRTGRHPRRIIRRDGR
jgi:hypothetical protein